jgi:hypothetical protein
MNFKIDEIYTFKLNSGEEVVAKVLEIGDECLIIGNPVSIGPTPSGKPGLIPSMFTYNIESSVELNTNSIAMIGLTDENIKSQYIQATTGLSVPSKKVIMG